MKIGELQTTKYLKKEDFPEPKLVTISRIAKENVALPNQPKKERGVMYFEECEKGMVMNKTNLMRAAKVCGSEETDDWKGKKIVIYTDEEVEFGGEMVGGLRLRGAKAQTQQAKPKGSFDDMMDDVPF